jgi:hypothetical protein
MVNATSRRKNRFYRRTQGEIVLFFNRIIQPGASMATVNELPLLCDMGIVYLQSR